MQLPLVHFNHAFTCTWTIIIVCHWHRKKKGKCNIAEKKESYKVCLQDFQQGYPPRLDLNGKCSLPTLTYGEDSHRPIPHCASLDYFTSWCSSVQSPLLAECDKRNLASGILWPLAPFQWIWGWVPSACPAPMGFDKDPLCIREESYQGIGCYYGTMLQPDPLVIMKCQIKGFHEPVLDYSLFSL